MCDCSLENQSGELVARKIKYLYPEDCESGVVYLVALKSRVVIVKIAFERKSLLVCGTGCRVTPNHYKIRCILSFTAFTLYLHLCLNL